MGDKEYIDQKFDEFKKEWRGDFWKIVAIMITMVGSIWGTILVQGTKIRNNEFDISILDARTEDLKYKTGWLVELSELQRDLLKGMTKNEDLSEYIERIGNIEKRVMAGGDPMPTLRGNKK